MSRPNFKPTPENRKLVRSLAAIGLRQEHICQILHIRSPKTLRKYFAPELAAGHAEALAVVTGKAYEMATSGKYPAMTIFWLKAHARWSEGMEIESTREKSMDGPGAELVFARPEPMTGSELDDFEYIGRDGEDYLYRHARDARPQQSGAPSRAGKRARTTQEESNVEA